MNSKWQAYIERRGGHLEPSHRSVFYRDPEPPVTGLPANFVIPCSEEVVLSCTGKDTIEFLQSQLTCDLRNLAENQFLLGAYCNPKGRVLASLRLYRTAEAIQLVTHHSVADALLSRLRMYVLRADVMITHSEETAIMCVGGFDIQDILASTSDVHACSAFGSDIAQGAESGPFPCTLVTGRSDDLAACWSSLPTDPVPLGSDYWSLLQIQKGIPSVTDSTSGLFTPQNINLDLIDAVSFKKGCYPGQEIVARMRYLGKVKQRMVRGRSSQSSAFLPGEAIYADESGAKSGTVVSSAILEDRPSELLMSVSDFQETDTPYHAKEPGGPEIRRLKLPYNISESR